MKTDDDKTDEDLISVTLTREDWAAVYRCLYNASSLTREDRLSQEACVQTHSAAQRPPASQGRRLAQCDPMSYRPGYRFKVKSTLHVNEDGKREEVPPILYEDPWDHTASPLRQWRSILHVLNDGDEVEVIEYTKNSAVFVRDLTSDMEGWLG